MANDLTQNPLILDTAGGGALATGFTKLYVKAVRWVGGTTAGHQCILKDASGDTKISMLATGANYTESELVEDWWDGIDLDTLGSGTAYVTLG